MAGTQTDLLCVGNERPPVSIGVLDFEMIVMCMGTGGGRAGKRRLGHDGIDAGLIQRHRIKGGVHSDVGNQRVVVVGVAVTLRGDVNDQGDMEAGTSLPSTALEYSAILQFITSTASSNPAFTGIHGTGADTSATAYTPAVVNGCLLAVDGDGVMGAVLPAFAAAHAERLDEPQVFRQRASPFCPPGCRSPYRCFLKRLRSLPFHAP